VNASALPEERETDVGIVQGKIGQRSDEENKLPSVLESDQQMNLVTGFLNDSFVS